MGERLVFKVIKREKRIATLYYHWSGYTGSIYFEAGKLASWLRDNGFTGEESIEKTQEMLLNFVQQNGGGVGDKYTFNEFKKRGINPKEDGYSRNDGLLDITDTGMREAERWGEHVEEFNLDDQTFTNNEFTYDDPEEFDWVKHPEVIPKWEPDPRYVGTINWDDAEDAMRWFDDLPRYDGVLGIATEDGKNYYVVACE
jgi:hypothetical protein